MAALVDDSGTRSTPRARIWRNEPDPPPVMPPSPRSAGSIIWMVLNDQWRTAAVGAFMGSGWMMSMAAVPTMLGLVIDRGVGGDTSALVRWSCVLAALGVSQASFGLGRHWIHNRLNHGIKLIVQDLVATRALDPRGGLEGVPAGDLVSRATADATRLGGLADLCCRGPGAAASFVFVFVLLVAASPALGLIVLAALPVLSGVTVPLWRPLARRSYVEQQHLADASAVTADGIVGLRVVKGLGAEKALIDGFGDVNDRLRDSSVSVARLSAWWTGLGILAPGILLAVIAWIGGRLVLDGSLSTGQLVAAFGYAMFLRTPLIRFAELGNKWVRAHSAATRVAELLDRPWAVSDHRTSSSPHASRRPLIPTVTFDAVCSSDHVIDDFTMTIDAGEVVGVAAADPRVPGALADLLARRCDPASGHILLHGADLRDLPLDEVRAAVLVAEHDPYLFAATLADNVAVHGGFDERHRRAASSAAVEEIANRLPEGWQSVLGERGRTLSGGQRQRVGLARGLAADSPVLVLIEPTSAVDAHTEVAVVAGLLALRDGRTTIMVSTSPAALAAVDRVVFIRAGMVAATGTHTTLLQHDPYRAVVLPERDQ